MGYLNTTQLNQLLKEPIISIVTTMRPDGTPHMTPVWHLVKEGKIIVAVEETSIKARNVRHNPTVGLCVAANESPQRWALINGTADMTKDDVCDVVTAMSLRYVSGEQGRVYAEKVLSELDFVLLIISPTNMIGFDGVE